MKEDEDEEDDLLMQVVVLWLLERSKDPVKRDELKFYSCKIGMENDITTINPLEDKSTVGGEQEGEQEKVGFLMVPYLIKKLKVKIWTDGRGDKKD